MKTALISFLILTIPSLAQEAAPKHKAVMSEVQSNPMFKEKKVATNPLHQAQQSVGVNPLFEETQRSVQGILIGLKPPVAAKVRAAAEELSRNPALHGPEDAAWRAAQDVVTRTFGANRPPDPLESVTVVVAGLALTGKRIDKASPLLAKISNVLKTKHDTVKNSINNVR